MKDYELYFSDDCIPLNKTPGRFYWKKLLNHHLNHFKDIAYLFKSIDDKNLQKQIFKEFVSIFNLETSGFCNRKCLYCPVSTYKRNDKSHLIDSSIFNKLLKNLESLEFNSSICLNYYNEPLLDPHILRHISDLKRATNAFIHFNSNGDYLDIEMLENLINAGLNRINITLHTKPNEIYCDDISLEKINQFYKKLDISIPQISINPSHSITTECKIDNFILQVNTINWSDIGSDRGGVVKTLSINNRINPCVRVFREIFFDFLGYAYLCCNIFPTQNNHIGSIQNQTIEEIYTKNYIYRKILFLYSKKPKPCLTCNDESFCDGSDKKDREYILNKI